MQLLEYRVVPNKTVGFPPGRWRLCSLPVQDRAPFKTLLLTSKALSGKAPSYITDPICRHSPMSPRSNIQSLLGGRRSQLKLKRDRLLFAIAAPH